MKKHIVSLMIVLLVATAFFFSGCSSPYSGLYRKTTDNNSAGISTGIVNSDPRTAKGDERTPIEIDNIYDASKAYEWFNGIKVAYDATANYQALTQNSIVTTLLEQIDESLLDGYSNFSIETFLANHSSVDYSAPIISRALWIENLIDQYQLLAKLLLVDIAGSYGLGYNEATAVNSIFYPAILLNENITPQIENAINCYNANYVDELSFNNPNFNSGYAYSSEQYINLNLSDGTMSIGENNFSISIPDSVVSEFDSFKSNLMSDADVVAFSSPSFSFNNPIYSSSATAPDLQSYQTLYVVGQVNNGQIEYTLNFIAPQNSALTSESFIQKYINEYSLYLAYKIFEISSQVAYQERYMGVANEISKTDFLPLINAYLQHGGMLGLVEKDWDLSSAGYVDFKQSVIETILEDIVGFDDAQIQSIVSNSVNNRLNQFIHTQNGETICVSNQTLDSSALFAIIPNVEWIDISKEKLLTLSNDDEEAQDFQLDAGNIIDVVFMTNESIEGDRYFECLMLMFATNFAPVELTTYFRYVQNGQQKVYSQFDYSLNEEPTESKVGTEIKIENNFDGTISTLPDEGLTQDYADNQFLYIPRSLVDAQGNDSDFYLRGFKNNSKSSTYICANSMNARNLYVFDSAKKTVYYNETSSDCDFIELSFYSICDNIPKFFFEFQDFIISDKDENDA